MAEAVAELGEAVPAVIVCLHSSHAPQLLSRNLLYTAVTRAGKLCVLAGDDRAIVRALRNTDATDRHSRLRARMLGRARPAPRAAVWTPVQAGCTSGGGVRVCEERRDSRVV